MYDNRVSDEDDYPANADIVAELETSDTGVEPGWRGDAVSAYPKLAANAEYGKGNPLRKLVEVIEPAPPHTIAGHVEWLTLRTASLHRWTEAGEKDLLLETLRRMEDDIRAIRSLLNTDVEQAAESELKFRETLRTDHRIANKTERERSKWYVRGPKW